MATFLQLCQAVARDSGTATGNQPTTVTGQVGRLGKIVAFTNEAWQRIQLKHDQWQWMRRQFAGSLIAGTDAYTPVALSLNDVAAWVFGNNRAPIVLHDPAMGRADDRAALYMDWDEFLNRFDMGPVAPQRPIAYSIRPADNALVFGPTPDKAYAVRGHYHKSPQVLVAATDVPECPPRYHDIIKWRALVMLAEHDEAVAAALPLARQNFNELMTDLERTQLPPIGFGVRPLA
jgi:hypothetical protein